MLPFPPGSGPFWPRRGKRDGEQLRIAPQREDDPVMEREGGYLSWMGEDAE
jgi:hypothetical protein